MTVTERYVGQVQRALFCTPLHRKKFIRDLEPLAEDFASENPHWLISGGSSAHRRHWPSST